MDRKIKKVIEEVIEEIVPQDVVDELTDVSEKIEEELVSDIDIVPDDVSATHPRTDLLLKAEDVCTSHIRNVPSSDTDDDDINKVLKTKRAISQRQQDHVKNARNKMIEMEKKKTGVIEGRLGILGVSTSTLDIHHNNLDHLISVSTSNLQSTEQYLPNEINAINLLAISSGKVDINYSILIAKHDSDLGKIIKITLPKFDVSSGIINGKVGILGIINTNTQHDINVFYDYVNYLGATNKDLIGISTNSLEIEINSIYNYFLGALDGKTNYSAFETLSGVVEALDTVYTAFSAAQTVWDTVQTGNNGTQQTEIIDSQSTRIDTVEEQLGISFTAKDNRINLCGTSATTIDQH